MLTEMRPEIILSMATLLGAHAIAFANVWNNYKTNKTNLRLTQKAHEEEKKQVKREKLELLLLAVYALKDWVSAYQSIWLFRPDAKEIKKLGESPIAKIQTLNALYFNELEASVAALSYHYYIYTGEIAEIAEPYLSNSKSLTDKEKEILQEHNIELIRLIIVVQNNCKTVMTNLDKW